MALSVNSVLSMGVGALFASQAAIQTTGNNISNVNTPGYSRQAVRLEDRISLDYYPGQVGQGVNAKEIFRYFDRFVESSYLDKFSLQRRYEEEYDLLHTVENIFNESNVDGLASAMSDMFKSWSTLAQEPNSQYARAALIEKANTLAAAVRSADSTMENIQEQLDGLIRDQVDKANSLINDIARLNREINAHTIEGRNNANGMMDERDLKVRQLAEILDIHVDDKGAGNYMVTTGSGMMLVQEDIPFSLSFQGPRVENNLVHNSTYTGTAEFSGTDGYEYTVEVVTGGTVDTTGANPPPAGTAQYRVSLDGGRTWLKDDNGNDKLFYATSLEYSTHVKDLDISFTDTNTAMVVGDKFLLTPKSDVYWVTPTAGPIDISTQIFADGTDNNLRITGGVLAGYLEFRDYKLGEYRDRLASLSDTLTWEVNRIHSQGSGLTYMSGALGDYRVERTNVALGSDRSGFHWFDKLQAGNMTFSIYDGTGQAVIPYPGLDVFSGANFDPSQHSLEDVVNAINSGPAGAYLTANIVDNRLEITAKSDASGTPYTFAITADTTGLAAGLGINTFFAGTTPGSITLRDEIQGNPSRINAARVNGAGEGNSGDNITAREIADLVKKKVNFSPTSQKFAPQSLNDFYATLVTRVGADTASAKFTAATERTMANELNDRREEISGVNLDEEMSNLIKFQASYKAAAKLITTADEMMQTLLSLKQ